MARLPLVLLLLLAIAACHKPPASVAGLSPDDAAQLNNAADTLDTSADDLTAASGSGDQENGAAENGQ